LRLGLPSEVAIEFLPADLTIRAMNGSSEPLKIARLRQYEQKFTVDTCQIRHTIDKIPFGVTKYMMNAAAVSCTTA